MKRITWDSEVYDSALLFREFGGRVRTAIDDISSKKRKRVQRGLILLGRIIDTDIAEAGGALCIQKPQIARALITAQGSKNPDIRRAALLTTGRFMEALQKDYSPSAIALRERVRQMHLAN